MRTTLTLDDDLAMMLKREAQASDRPFRDVVNDAIRRGLLESSAPRTRIEVPVFNLGYGAVMAAEPWDTLANDDAVRLRELTGVAHPADAEA